MQEQELKQLLQGLQAGDISLDDALDQLRSLPYKDLGFAKLDTHRQLRQGFGEVIYAPQKTPEQCSQLVSEILAGSKEPVLLSLPDEAQAERALAENPGGHRTQKLITWRPAPSRSEKVCIISAGTADAPVAQECQAVLAVHGIEPQMIMDSGVAGLHRLLANVDRLIEAELIVVVAGMEGALASVVGGITPAPVIAVPTSVGYGASLEGVTALLSMLSTCAAGVAVVGIDNGLGAAFVALRQFNAQTTKD